MSPPASHENGAAKQGLAGLAPANNQETSRNTNPSQNKTPERDVSAEWALFWVAILTLGVLVYQANEMRKATDEMRESTVSVRRQIDLQEVALRQWVDIKEWRSTPWIPEGGALSLHVQFNVVNPTDRPLTLNGVFIAIGEQQNSISRKNLIPPKNWHPVVVSIKITEEQMLKWNEDKISFFVSGQVIYEDVLEKVRNQPFNGMIVCSKKDGVVFIPPYGSGLYIGKPEKDSKNPN